MSCNKTEALREKRFAEELIISNDYVSARDKLRKAQQLFPALDHITPMLAVCEILSASRNISPGFDIDYYWVLHLQPSASVVVINNQYQSLVSLLQPIKNKFPGTDLALKFLDEAFFVLSDKKRRFEFDIKRGTCWGEVESFKSRNLDDPGTFRNSGDTPKEDITSFKLTPNLEISDLGPNWSMSDFMIGQVWAVYSGRDLMPRRYCLIKNLFLKDQVGVTFLAPEQNVDQESVPIVCGIFREKEKSVNLYLSLFSHQVICEKKKNAPLYRVYPRKGEVWALYQNLNRGKCADNRNQKCDIVEIVSDGERTILAKLVQVNGFLTFFQTQQCEEGFDLIRTVSKEEMLYFSHRIPSFRVPGIIKYGIPESCWHLEPVALPHKLG